MERKELEKLGLSKEQIDTIMAENGKDIEAQKVLTTAESEKLKTANGTITTLQDSIKKFDGVDIEKLKKDAVDWQTKYNDDLGKLKLEHALETALLAGKAKNTKAVKALLEIDKIKLDGDKLLGLDDQLEKLKKDNDYLFQQETKPGSKVVVDSSKTHTDPPGGTETTTLLGALKEKYKGD